MLELLIAEATTESPKEFNFPASRTGTLFHQGLGGYRPGEASHRSLAERRANLLQTNWARPETDARAIIDRSQTSIERPQRGNSAVIRTGDANAPSSRALA